jgi:hypothetical protein
VRSLEKRRPPNLEKSETADSSHWSQLLAY